MRFAEKVKSIVSRGYDEITLNWKKPSKGNYVSYKEMMSYALGGMGQHMIIYVVGFMGLSAGNLLIGSTIGLRPLHLQYMAIIQTVLNFFMSIVRSKLIDNTRTRYGRFRPYLALMGIPIASLTTLMVFLPFDTMGYNEKLIFVFGFAIAISFISPMYTDTYTILGAVMTPKSDERAKMIMLTTLVSSFAPTIYQAVIPLILNATGLTYYTLATYRYVIVMPLGFLGAAMNLFTAFGCKERVISSKTYVQKVGLFEGVLNIYKNKYWWIKNIANLVAFLESGFAMIFTWMLIYSVQDMVQYSIFQTLYGTASTIAMLLTPFLLKRWGNRKILLVHNSLNIVFITMMLLTYTNVYLFFIILYINTAFNQLQLVYNPVLEAEIKDYQQYLTGKRMDFMFSAAGQILLPITLLSGFVFPFIYEYMGLTTNYDVLFDPLIRNKLFSILCLLSIFGAAFNLVPFFFYRLSREKHEMIVLALKQRAAANDLANGEVAPELVVEVVDGLNGAAAIRAAEMPDVKAARKAYYSTLLLPIKTKEQRLFRREERKKATEELFAKKHLAENKEALAEIFDAEQGKFDSAAQRFRLELARELLRYTPEQVADAKIDYASINTDVSSEKERKRMETVRVKDTKAVEKMKLMIRKNYPDGLKEDYILNLSVALDLPDGTKEEIKIKKKAISEAEGELLLYNKVFNYSNKAVELMTEYENRKYIDGLFDMYDESKTVMADKEADERKRAEEEKERYAVELAVKKQLKFDSYSPKKQKRITERKERLARKKAEREEKK